MTLRHDLVRLVEVNSESGEELDGFLLVRVSRPDERHLEDLGVVLALHDPDPLFLLPEPSSVTGFFPSAFSAAALERVPLVVDTIVPVEQTNSQTE
ncbi:unnamed protein product [Microthlaspi erraticum]|uniref:Uncharacterized protein n=1 Tax=Microthlaspi erraticum TaxID=1685480 RepID=A0A6D2L131_9BRAS|nr:unnamed protein product [Microthlaspi erraticum]